MSARQRQSVTVAAAADTAAPLALTLAGEGVDDLFLDTLLSLGKALVLSNRHFLNV